MRSRLDSKALALFVAVAESLNFRQAAQQLHMTQPPLSRAIQQLEQRLAVALFVRSATGVSLTAAGQQLLPRARRILLLLAEAEAALAPEGQAQVLRLGLASAIDPAWFSPALARLQARLQDLSPALGVETCTDTSPKLVRLLRAHRLQAAWIALPTEAAGLEVHAVQRQPMVVAMASSHPLARRRKVSLAQLNGEPMFWFERARQPAFFDHCQRIFARHGFAPRLLREPVQHPLLLAEVVRGTAMALLPDSFTSLKRSGLSYRPLAEGDELALGLGLVLAPELPAAPAGLRQALIDALR